LFLQKEVSMEERLECPKCLEELEVQEEEGYVGCPYCGAAWPLPPSKEEREEELKRFRASSPPSKGCGELAS